MLMKYAIKTYLESIVNDNTSIQINDIVEHNVDTMKSLGITDDDIRYLKIGMKIKYYDWIKYVDRSKLPYREGPVNVIDGEDLLDDEDIEIIKSLTQPGVIRVGVNGLTVVDINGTKKLVMVSNGVVCTPVAIESIRRYEYAASIDSADDMEYVEAVVNSDIDPDVHEWIYLIRTDEKINLRK